MESMKIKYYGVLMVLIVVELLQLGKKSKEQMETMVQMLYTILFMEKDQMEMIIQEFFIK